MNSQSSDYDNHEDENLLLTFERVSGGRAPDIGTEKRQNNYQKM
jgi:hypothetical protein